MRNVAQLSKHTVFLVAVALSLALGVVDWASGYELQFFVFYFLPITLAGWNCGLARTLCISALCGGLWFSIDIYSGHPYSNWLYAIWSAMIRVASFLANGYSVVQIKELVLSERAAAAALQQARSEVRLLQRLLPICARCKGVRDDKGYWVQLEEYLSQHTGVLVEHDGFCNACETRMLEDAGVQVPSAGDRSYSA